MSPERFDRPPAALWRLAALLMLIGCVGPRMAIGHEPPADDSKGRVVRVDLVLRGGRVMDGSGAPASKADVAVHKGRIHAVGDLADLEAERDVDVRGLVIAPGFIDLHSHADVGLGAADEKLRAAGNLVSQGITTVVVNQDGFQQGTIAHQKAAYKERGIGPNAILMVGHNTVRRQVLKSDYRRAATAQQIDEMRRLVRQGMQSGAYGLSAGLEYVPGIWSTTDEMVALVEEIVPLGGVCIVHERASGADPMWFLPSRHAAVPPDALDTIRELVEIAERTRATVVATHIKARGAGFWGASRVMIGMIEAARKRGLRLYADQYPYNTTGSDGRLVLVPEWVRERAAGERSTSVKEGRRNLAAELTTAIEDETVRADIERDVGHEINRRGGAGNITIMDHPDASLIGKTLAEAAARVDVSPVEMALRLQLEGDPHRAGGARLRGYSLSELDVEAFAAQPWTATSTDAGITLSGKGDVHARFYGSYPRKIRHYAIDRGVLSVEAAVRSSTSLPAEILGLADRGQIRQGFWADLVVFDLDRIRDKATFPDPHQYSEGVEYVLVAGTAVVDKGELTGALAGRVISPPPRSSTNP
ncbi:MAG: amidohydrolase family protein [Pirellulales bacterium]